MSVFARASAAVLAALLAGGGAFADEHHHHKKKKQEDEQQQEQQPPTQEQPQAPTQEQPPVPTETAPSAPPTASAGLPRLTVHVYDEESPAAAPAVLAAFADVAGKDTRVAYRDLAELLEPPEEVDRALAAADADLKSAGEAFDQMDLENAHARVEKALKTYERYLPELGKRGRMSSIRDAWIRLAAVRFFDGNNDAAKDALRHVFVFDPKVDYSPKLFPPQMKKAVIEGRLLFDALGTGKLTVSSEPPGAAVYINGVRRGETQLTIDDAPPGPNYVTVVKRGFAPASATVEIAGGGEEGKSELTLARYENDPMIPLGQARDALGADEMPPALVDASKRLRAEMVIAVRLLPAQNGIKVAAFLYDARPRHLIRRVEKSGPVGSVGETAKQAAIELLDRVRTDGVWVPPETPKKPSFFATLLSRMGERVGDWRRSKYFWPSLAIAGGLVVVGVVVGVAVAATEHHGLSPSEQVILLGGSGGFALPRF